MSLLYWSDFWGSLHSSLKNINYKKRAEELKDDPFYRV